MLQYFYSYWTYTKSNIFVFFLIKYFCKSFVFKEFKVYFCGQYFLDETECAIPNETSLSKNFIRDICVKNLPADMRFDILYSEII